MADEAVLRIVLDDSGNPTPPPAAAPSPPSQQETKALSRGDASPWAPPSQPIPAPAGMRSDKAEYLRMEAEAARRGISVKDYKKAEVETKTSGAVVPPAPPPLPPAQPSTPPAPAVDPHEERRLFNEKRARDRAASQPPPSPAQVQAAPPEPPKTEPVPVDIVKPPPTVPPPAAPPTTQPPTPPRDWMRDLVEGIAGANRHVLVEGESGSGKSSMARNIAFERAKRGEEVNVLDPHKPETWKGVNKAFTRESAADFAEMMLDTLRQRETASVDARSRGEKIDFKPITFVLSDFAAIAKDFPKLKEVMQTVLTEGRKFNVAVLAETAGFNAEEIGAGTVAMRRNFKQKLEMFAPGPGEPDRTAKMGKDTFKTPDLSSASDENKDRFDPSIVQYKSTVQPPEPEPEPPFDPIAVAKKRVEAEERRAAVDAEYAKLKPPDPITLKPAFDPLEVAKKRVKAEEERAAADAAYAKLKPPEPEKVKSGLDSLLEVTESLRGTLGGTFGGIVGTALDVAAKMRDLRAKASEEGAANAAEAAGAKGPGEAGGIANRFRVPEAAPGAWQGAPTKKPTNQLADLASTTQPPTAVPKSMLGDIASAAPYIAIALAVDQAVKGAVRGVVGGVGGMAKSLSSPNDDAASSIEGVSSAISGLGQVIPGVGVALVAVGEVGKVVAGLMDNFTKMAEKYGEYNPAIAQAQAMADVKKMMGDMRRAQESGPELVKFLRAQADLQNKFEDVKMKIWMKVLPILTSIMEAVADILGIAKDQQFDIKDPTDFILNPEAVRKVREGATSPLSAPADILDF